MTENCGAGFGEFKDEVVWFLFISDEVGEVKVCMWFAVIVSDVFWCVWIESESQV